MTEQEFQRILASHKRIAIVGGPKTGKAQPVDARVVTEDGFRPIGDIRIGDRVVASNGRMTPVTGVFPQGVKPVFRIYFSDETHAECCEEHLWLVRGKADRSTTRDFKTVTTRQIIGNLLDGSDRSKRMYIPMVCPVQFKKQNLLLDPYFMGIMIGDGGMTDNNHRLSSADSDIIKSLVLPTGIYCDKIPGNNVDYYLTTRERGKLNLVTKALRHYGLQGCDSRSKFVPHDYLLSDERDRLSVLQGLMDSDGWAQGVSSYFCSVSEGLCREVQWLAQSLGIWARVALKQGKYKGERHESFRVTLSSDDSVFRLSRKKTSIQARQKPSRARAIQWVEFARNAECVCISTEHGTYCTNDFIVTHNTTLSNLVTDRPVHHNDDGKHIPWEDQPKYWMEQVDGQDSFVIEGVQAARALRKGLQVDAVIELDKPWVELSKGQAAMSKGHKKIFGDVLSANPGTVVYK